MPFPPIGNDGPKSSADAVPVPLSPDVEVVSLAGGHSFVLAIVKPKSTDEPANKDAVINGFPVLELAE